MSERKTKVEGLIKEAAANFVRQEANTDPLITITRVDIAPNFKSALIFYTTIPDGKEDIAGVFLKRSAGNFRSYLKKNAHMKVIPHIDFMLDAGERHRQHVDEVFREIENE